jgi:hypothetical protein
VRANAFVTVAIDPHAAVVARDKDFQVARAVIVRPNGAEEHELPIEPASAGDALSPLRTLESGDFAHRIRGRIELVNVTRPVTPET